MKKIAIVISILAALSVQCAVFAAQPAPVKPAAAQDAKPAEGPTVPDTLMFTIDEFNDIQGHLARTGDDTEKKNSDIESASLYLSTIVYAGPNDWTVWINGVPITPQQEFPAFKVTEISPRYVDLLVPLSAQGMRPVRLGPNQTFLAKLGVVVEGHQ